MNRTELIQQLYKFVNQIECDKIIHYNQTIDILIGEYKTRANSGYIKTFQSILLENYEIKCNFMNVEQIAGRVIWLSDMLKNKDIEYIINNFTHPQNDIQPNIREWN